MAQATSGKIVCSDWLRRVTWRSVIVLIGRVRITGVVSHFVYKGTTKGNFEKQQIFNKSSTKSCMSRTIYKKSLTIIKAITTRKTTLKITILCHVICIYTITWLLGAFSLVVDRDLLKDTHTWRQIHAISCQRTCFSFFMLQILQ